MNQLTWMTWHEGIEMHELKRMNCHEWFVDLIFKKWSEPVSFWRFLCERALATVSCTFWWLSAMMGRQLAIDNPPQLGSFLTKLPLIFTLIYPYLLIYKLVPTGSYSLPPPAFRFQWPATGAGGRAASHRSRLCGWTAGGQFQRVVGGQMQDPKMVVWACLNPGQWHLKGSYWHWKGDALNVLFFYLCLSNPQDLQTCTNQHDDCKQQKLMQLVFSTSKTWW